MTLLGLLAGLGVIWTVSIFAVGIGILFALAYECDKRLSDEIELPTWSEADECREDENLDRALREWQQSVELPMARPLSRSSVLRLKRPLTVSDVEAQRVKALLFPRARKPRGAA